MRKSCKRSSLSLNNSKRVDPTRSTSCVDLKTISQKESGIGKCEQIKNPNSDKQTLKEHNFKKRTLSPRKILYDLTDIKAPVEEKSNLLRSSTSEHEF